MSFDESLNDMISLLVRYFDETESKIKVRFCDAQFFFQGTLLDLQKQFNKTVKELDPNKQLQIGMDGPNVDLKFLKFIQQDQKENEKHQLIDIGSCGLHIMNDAFKIGAEKPDWRMKKILPQQEEKTSSQSLVQTSFP